MAKADIDYLRNQRYRECRLATEAIISKINTPSEMRTLEPSVRATTMCSTTYNQRGEQLIDSITTLDHLLPKCRKQVEHVGKRRVEYAHGFNRDFPEAESRSIGLYRPESPLREEPRACKKDENDINL